jgi:hypothetical protein
MYGWRTAVQIASASFPSFFCLSVVKNLETVLGSGYWRLQLIFRLDLSSGLGVLQSPLFEGVAFDPFSLQ